VALAAFAPLGERLGTSAEAAARKLLDGAVRKVAAAAAEAAKHYRLDPDVPLVALGGAGAALVPEVARVLGRRAELPRHAEVLSAVGAAVSLVRSELMRSISGDVCAVELARSAERSCIDGGAAPSSVSVETVVDNAANVIRAVATGSVALQAGAVDHREASDDERDAAAAAALEIERSRLAVVAVNDYYRVYSGNGTGGVAVIDRFGAVALADTAEDVVVGERETFVADLRRAVASASRQLGVATMLPRVCILAGSRMVDLSSAHSLDDIARAAQKMLEDQQELAVAVIAR
jgi:hypothetical protein